ncbi:hypothetical protein E8E12_009580 [Didymella heteroderae]|uniref:Uncharacterized protein n=1 Tax=Didymella heteroderae TaxID=1769908 RepID=A0A9P4WV96_9PLEO|nr:hypothetical protein E8E12_009580 [Didymella heteroderae]
MPKKPGLGPFSRIGVPEWDKRLKSCRAIARQLPERMKEQNKEMQVMPWNAVKSIITEDVWIEFPPDLFPTLDLNHTEAEFQEWCLTCNAEKQKVSDRMLRLHQELCRNQEWDRAAFLIREIVTVAIKKINHLRKHLDVDATAIPAPGVLYSLNEDAAQANHDRFMDWIPRVAEQIATTIAARHRDDNNARPNMRHSSSWLPPSRHSLRGSGAKLADFLGWSRRPRTGLGAKGRRLRSLSGWQ